MARKKQKRTSNIPRAAWNNYVVKMRTLSEKAADELIRFIMDGHDPIADPNLTKEVIDYAYALATKYGEASGALACEMYDALATLCEALVPPSLPAATATYGETAKAIHGTMLQSKNPDVMADAVGRLVKMAGVDTMQQNALRDGAEWAWIPSGDTCAFCITLASRGWQPASRDAIKGGHAEHVHANCDCTYAVRFNQNMKVEGYDPDEYWNVYYYMDGDNSDEKINSMRRYFYEKNKEKINEQKRAAYQKRKELNSSAAEEIDVN